MANNPKALSGLMSKAHFNASWKQAGGDKRPYREIFSEMLRHAWSDLKQAQEAKKSAVIREQLREEQNFGLPVSSFRTERTYFRSSRLLAVGE
jgi:hypothetical protein